MCIRDRTCLDGYPLTKQGKGGTALGITMICSFFAASVGIIVMIFASPLLVEVAFKFGPTEIFSIMLLGLLAGATMSRGSPLKGVAMTLFGLMCGVVGTDAVSYTHLDVYKRQAQFLLGAGERDAVQLALLDRVGQAVAHVVAAIGATHDACLLYTSRCVQETGPRCSATPPRCAH